MVPPTSDHGRHSPGSLESTIDLGTFFSWSTPSLQGLLDANALRGDFEVFVDDENIVHYSAQLNRYSPSRKLLSRETRPG
jgi:hypothetical protein